MERTFSPMIRQFSAIDGLQKAYTLVYSTGCRRCTQRLSADTLPHRQRTAHGQPVCLAAAPESCYRILQYLCENGVQPEIWQDVMEELTTADRLEAERRGAAWTMTACSNH